MEHGRIGQCRLVQRLEEVDDQDDGQDDHVDAPEHASVVLGRHADAAAVGCPLCLAEERGRGGVAVVCVRWRRMLDGRAGWLSQRLRSRDVRPGRLFDVHSVSFFAWRCKTATTTGCYRTVE